MGVLLLLVSFLFGYCIIKDFLSLKKSVVVLCGAFIVGNLFAGTFLYLLDLLFVYTLKNYFLSNIVFIAAALAYAGIKVKSGLLKELKRDIIGFLSDKWALRLFVVSMLFMTWLFYHVFNVSSGNINVVGAYGDIMFHNTISRTVSYGHNIPMQYPFFANSSMHYHFLFDYYIGKIAQVGLNTVHAMNIMSILSFTFLLLLIFKFGEIYFKSKAAGILGAVFLLFHSSIAAFPWLKDNIGSNILKALFDRQGWLGNAAFESWGLFNIVVFLAQRHLIFTGALLVFLVICFLEDKNDKKSKTNLNVHFMKKNILIGMVIAATPFWNVAVTVSCLGIIGFMALCRFKNRRLFFGTVYALFIALLFIIPQLFMFKSGDTVLSGYPKIHAGYALENFTFAGFAVYYFKVLGLKVFFIIGALLILPLMKKLDMLAFLIPFILANVLQIGFVLYDNNKMIILSLIFINCFVAHLIVLMFKKMPKFTAFIPAVLIFTLVLSGIVDLFAAKNMAIYPIKDDSSGLKQWIVNNTKREAVFLTNPDIPVDDNAITTVNLSGRLVYGVYNFSASCYDVGPRIQNVKSFYSFEGDPNELKTQLRKEKIDYIIIDRLVTGNQDFKVNIGYFDNNFKRPYNEDGISVYAVD